MYDCKLLLIVPSRQVTWGQGLLGKSNHLTCYVCSSEVQSKYLNGRWRSRDHVAMLISKNHTKGPIGSQCYYANYNIKFELHCHCVQVSCQHIKQ